MKIREVGGGGGPGRGKDQVCIERVSGSDRRFRRYYNHYIYNLPQAWNSLEPNHSFLVNYLNHSSVTTSITRSVFIPMTAGVLGKSSSSSSQMIMISVRLSKAMLLVVESTH